MPIQDAEIYDVVIVGSGPAGNSASITCARAGLKVLQLEREALPRPKTCGGGLSHRTLQALPLAVDAVIERRIDQVFVCAGPDRMVSTTLRRPGAMVCRETFDHFMAQAAHAAGSELQTGCAFLGFAQATQDLVRVATSGGTVLTRVLVGADGVHSQVRKGLFPGRRGMTVPAIEARITPRAGVLQALASKAVIDFRGLPGGYGWIFPKADHLNAGLYRLQKTRTNLNLMQSFRHYIESVPWLREGRIDALRGFEIPIQPVPGRLVEGQVLLVGDAAGLGEAFFGEGIYFAVRSGCQAGEAIVANLRQGVPLASYAVWVRALRRDLFISRLTARLFYRMPGFGFERMVRNPFVSRLFSGVVSGEVSPWECLRRSTLWAPLWLLQARSETTALTAMTGS